MGDESTRIRCRAQWNGCVAGCCTSAAAPGHRFSPPRVAPPLPLRTAFRKGLVEAGMSEGPSVAIEDRWADGQYDRLPALAADLVSRQATVIPADFLPAALAARAATPETPIVFLTGSDPIASGLVSSINRPTGNVAGIAFMFTRLAATNLALLRAF